MNKHIGRNDPCPCGSGKKYKKCCFLKVEVIESKLSGQIIEVQYLGMFLLQIKNFYLKLMPGSTLKSGNI